MKVRGTGLTKAPLSVEACLCSGTETVGMVGGCCQRGLVWGGGGGHNTKPLNTFAVFTHQEIGQGFSPHAKQLVKISQAKLWQVLLPGVGAVGAPHRSEWRARWW